MRPPIERREVGQPRPGERAGDRDQRLPRLGVGGAGSSPGAAERRARSARRRRPRRPRSPPDRPPRTSTGPTAPSARRTRGSGRGRRPPAAGNSPTGVETSASSSVHTGTSGHWAASESNSSRPGLTCRCGSTCAPSGRYRRIRARIGGAGTEEPRTVGPGLRGLAVRARDLRTRRHEAPRAPTPRPGHPVHPHQAAIVPAERRRRQRRGRAVPLSCGTHAPVQIVRADAARGSGGSRDREPSPLAPRWVRAPGDVRGLHDPPARPADDAEDRDHRPRGDGRGRFDRAAHADRPSGRPVEGDRPLRPLRGHPLQADGSPRSRPDPRPHAGRGRRLDGGRRPPVLSRPAEERLPGRMEVPRRVPSPIRDAPRSRVPDEGRVFDRPRRGRHAGVVPDHVRGVRTDLRLGSGWTRRSSRRTRGRSAAASTTSSWRVRASARTCSSNARTATTAPTPRRPGRRRRSPPRKGRSRSPRSTRPTRRRSSPWRRC